MLTEDLISRYPRLFHMANAGSWETSIRDHGLQTTAQIVNSSGLPAAEVALILESRRPNSIPIDHPILGSVAIRDQRPLNLIHLAPKLTDVTVTEWLAILNDRVFFWLHPDKLEQLLNARMYRAKEQDVLTIDTRSLLSAHGREVRLSPINSGASLWPSAASRGTKTFLPIDQYDYAERRRGRNDQTAIVELAVVGGVPDIVDHVVRVERRKGPDVLSTIYSAP